MTVALLAADRLEEQQLLAVLRDGTGPRLADPDEHAVFLAALEATEPCS